MGRHTSAVFLALVVLAASGCTQFKSNHSETKSSSLANLDPAVQEGAKLYSNNCAGCHGALSASTKLNRSASQIETARTTITQMSANSGVMSLTSTQIQQIAAALSTSTPVDLTNPFTCNNNADPAVAVLRRLTYREYLATILDLFSGNLTQADIQTQLDGLTKEAVVDHPAVRLYDTTNPASVNFRLIATYNDIAAKAADVITASAARMNAVAGNACISASTVADSCVNTMLDSFGLRAYRRPLTSDEKNLYVTLYRTGASSADSFARVLQALLSSPPFLYHIENNGTEVAGRTDLFQKSPYEIASRLSYMIIGSMPDAALFTAAANGSLNTAAGIQSQTDRLFALTKAREAVRDFYSQWLRLDILPVMNVTASFANGVDPAGFQQEAKQEIIDFMDNVIWTQKGNHNTLLSSNLIFPRGPNLARVYGVATSTQPVASSDPNRKGLLTRAGVLSISPAGTTSPIMRGVRVRFHVLCDNLGTPPANAAEMGATADPLASTRKQIEVKTSPAQCTSCHSKINPSGFAFENFDAFGRYRLQETVTYNGQSANWPIDAKVVPNVNSLNEAVTDGAVQMQEAILKYNRAPACMAKQYFAYNNGRLPSSEDNCSLQPMYDALVKNGGGFQEMFKALTQTSSFKLKKIN